MKPKRPVSELRALLSETRQGLATIIVLSTALNVLLLGGSIYMMLVYDSVLPSRSLPTLFGLLVLIMVVYIFQGIFEVFRSRVLADMAAGMTARLAPRVQQAISYMSLRKAAVTGGGDALSPMRDLDTMRNFLQSPGPTAFLDLPWVLFFLIVLALLHPWLAVTALIGTIVMIGLTFLAAKAIKEPTETVSAVAGQRAAMAEETRRHVELVHSLGMGQRTNTRWNALNHKMLAANEQLGDTSAVYGNVSKIFRQFLQSLVLTVGALLVIGDKASGGVIFASSILSARALQPIDQVVAQWRSFAAAKLAYRRLDMVLANVPHFAETSIDLPPPSHELAVENLFSGPPGTQTLTVQGVSLKLKAGDALGIIGPSAAGKSSLVRSLLGIWPAVRGSVRLDGAEISQWSSENLGAHLGYLPQSVELFAGTVADNISRLAENPSSDDVIAAARAAGVHDMIVRLPRGYDTQVGADGDQLSAGQRQRIALARALYGDPFLVVLDEPNSNLDSDGELALDAAIESVRARNGIVIIVAHRRAAIAHVSHLLVMREGRGERFGPRDEILSGLVNPQAPPPPSGQASPAPSAPSPAGIVTSQRRIGKPA